MDWVIQTHDLSKAYGDVAALQSLNLKVPPHSILGRLSWIGAAIGW